MENKKKIMIVEDDDPYRAVLVEFLSEFDLTILEARNGRDALAIWKRLSVDLILTDLVMPEMDGVSLILEIRSSGSSIPIVAMSGGTRNVEDLSLQKALSAGADRVIQKPFRFSELAGLISDLINISTSN